MQIEFAEMAGIFDESAAFDEGNYATLLTACDSAWYIISVVSVCLSDDNFQKPHRRKFMFAHLPGIRVKFVRESYQVKVEVTGARKGLKCLFPQCETLVVNNSGSINIEP